MKKKETRKKKIWKRWTEREKEGEGRVMISPTNLDWSRPLARNTVLRTEYGLSLSPTE